MKLIWQLLRQHVSVLQLAGFLVTNLVGVAIVLTAVQLYRDVTPALQAPDSFLDNDFIILTKEVEGAGIGKTSFTQTELAELAEQPFTEALGEFTPARYSVMGGISLAGIGMRTYLFSRAYPTVSSMSGATSGVSRRERVRADHSASQLSESL